MNIIKLHFFIILQGLYYFLSQNLNIQVSYLGFSILCRVILYLIRICLILHRPEITHLRFVIIFRRVFNYKNCILSTQNTKYTINLKYDYLIYKLLLFDNIGLLKCIS